MRNKTWHPLLVFWKVIVELYPRDFERPAARAKRTLTTRLHFRLFISSPSHEFRAPQI